MSKTTTSVADNDALPSESGIEEAVSITSGGALLSRMKAIGIDYIFANSGTDFPPVIEGLAEADAKNIDLPGAIVIPHESAAMGMAHGYYLGTGKNGCGHGTHERGSSPTARSARSTLRSKTYQ